jgi:hypothetical protein
VSTTTAAPVRRLVQRSKYGVPIQSGQVQVEQQRVGSSGGDDVYCLLAVSASWSLAEQVAKPVPDDAMAVIDHHPDPHGAGARIVSTAPGCTAGVHGAAELGDR